jgi:tripartite-type tricarboxylate transporter receptor subunit TctC
MKNAVCALLGLILVAAPTAVYAEAYPDHSIKMIVPFTPGGIADVAARKLGARLSEELGQPIIIDNRPGANSNIGTQVAARSPADGYTLLFAAVATIAINVHMYGTTHYDPVKDFQPIALVAKQPLVLTVGAPSPYKSVADLITAAKAKPGALNFGSAGVGSASHLALQMFNVAADVDIVHVPYRGTGPVMPDLISGRVNGYFDAVVSATGYLQSNSTRALGVASLKRVPALPDTPTIAETLPNFEFTTWIGVLAPAGLPVDKTNKLNDAIMRSMADPDVSKWFAEQSLDHQPGTPDEFAAFIGTEIEKFGKIISASGMKAPTR